MKKIGKKFSFLTKVFLVLGILFSNLSSLSIVFADEVTNDFTVKLDDSKLNVEIQYLKDVDDTDVIYVNVDENYRYLDDSVAGTINQPRYTSNGSEIKSGLTRLSQMLATNIFDGLYQVKVTLYNYTDDIELGIVTYQEDIRHDAGLKFDSLIDSTNNPVTFDATAEEYNSNDPILKATFMVQTGGLVPNEMYTLGDTTYTVADLLNTKIVENIDFSNHLNGKHIVEVERTITDSHNHKIELSTNIDIFYGIYINNDTMINISVSTLGLNNKYVFNSYGQKDGTIIVSGNNATKYNLLDIFNIAEDIMNRTTGITYKISTPEYDDVREAYLEYVANYVGEPTEMLTEIEFFSNIELADGMILALSCGDLTVTYSTLYLGDINNDGLITVEDITLLVDKVIGKDTTLSDNANLYVEDPEAIDIKDVMVLKNLNENGLIDTLTGAGHSIDARLVVGSSDITSGDTFTVNYIIKAGEFGINAFQGLVNYDKTKLELVSIEKGLTTLTGNNFEGKFLYLNDTVLKGTSSLNALDQTVWTDEDYTALTVTFKALNAGTSTVEIKDYQFFNDNDIVIYGGTDIKTDVTVNASDDNTLGSLSVAGQTIQLVPNVLEYTLTVENEVTVPNVEAITNNIAATISSRVVPEQLSVGENTITLTVTAENGDIKVYTIIVTRKEAPRTTQTTYQPDDNKEDVVTSPSSSSDSNIKEKETPKEEDKISRVVIIILILGVIGGLVYLIFKDEPDEEMKKANKEINKFKKEPIIPPKKEINIEPQKGRKEIKNPANKPQSKNNNAGKRK